MNSILKKRKCYITLYMLLLLIVGYYFGYSNINSINKYYYFNELSISDIFFHNFIITIITLLLSSLGGILSIIVISFNLLGLGFAICEVQIRLKTSLLKVLIPTLLHGLGEILVMFMIINISIDIFFIWYYKIIKEKKYNFNIISNYIKVIIASIPILIVSSIIEVLVSARLFENIFLFGG